MSFVNMELNNTRSISRPIPISHSMSDSLLTKHFDLEFLITDYTLNNIGPVIDSLKICNSGKYSKIIRFALSLCASYGVQKIGYIIKKIYKCFELIMLKLFFKKITTKTKIIFENASTLKSPQQNESPVVSESIYYMNGPIYEIFDRINNNYTYNYINILNGKKVDECMKNNKPSILVLTWTNDKLQSSYVNCFETYPREIYINLKKIIDKYIDASKKMLYYKPINIILNGEPGTGKTTFCDYLGLNQEGYLIDKINMVNFNMLPTEIMQKYRNTFGMPGKSVICFDEIDKAFHKYIENVTEGKTKIQLINEYISDLFNLVDGNTINLTDNVIFVFCSNNFSYIMDYCPEQYKKALTSRFIYREVPPLDRDELYNFLIFYDSKLHKNDKINYKEEIKTKIESLSANYMIPARDLHNKFTISFFDFEKVLENL
jgi:hypothetical protein